jgi:para-aminobenzoate synthetase component 1
MHKTLKCCTFPIADASGFKKKVLNWLRPFSTFCFLDNQQYSAGPHEAELLVAAGVKEEISGSDIRKADGFFQKNVWLFGHLSYALKESLHGLGNEKEDRIGFLPFYLFSPQVVLQLKDAVLSVNADDPEDVFGQIMKAEDPLPASVRSPVAIRPALARDEYINRIQSLQAHILRGDCYEINFCQEFYASGIQIEPFQVFQHLMEVSPNPFSAFYRLQEKYLLCASPERFLTRKGSRIISQPIKGTIQRNFASEAEDEKLKESLRLSPKEQAENVMIVDLVRNDLTRICKPASVEVEELFGIYSFPQVHQMISTISGEQKENVTFSQLLEATFPMGSMTGAPKLRVMQLIDEYEPSARGIFSGSVGYKAPNGDFDFNVVIRSIMYNEAKGHLSYQVGSGITFYSDAEKEWDECLLKAEAIRTVLC